MNGTRAVLRPVEPAQSGVDAPERYTLQTTLVCFFQATCAACNGRIIFSARWSHVDQFHFDCYAEAGEPYGEAVA